MKTETKTKWTHFMDMHSGGGRKLDWEHIYIEAPESEAKIIFQNMFGRNPHKVTCTCCGNDYSLSEEDSLAQASAYYRNLKYGYFDKEGNIVPEKEAWVRGKGVKPEYTGGYIEGVGDDGLVQYGGEVKTPIPLEEYVKQPDVKVVYAKDITPEMRVGELRQSGYVWVGD